MKVVMLLKLFLISYIFIITTTIYADNGPPIKLQRVRINLRDRASLLRGAKTYAQYCMVCHTMRYLAHNKLAQEAGITLDKMPLKQKEWDYGIVPPDLTLIARQYSANWLFTYMLSFYKDSSRPTGFNNLLKKDINMPNIFSPFQGEQVLTPAGKELLANPGFRKPSYHTVLELVRQGSMTPDQFDKMTTDLVNFFVYASDPGRLLRIHIGIAVILFLIVFFIIVLLLKKLYWKNVPHE